jgi:hypothetical protein
MAVITMIPICDRRCSYDLISVCFCVSESSSALSSAWMLQFHIRSKYTVLNNLSVYDQSLKLDIVGTTFEPHSHVSWYLKFEAFQGQVRSYHE